MITDRDIVVKILARGQGRLLDHSRSARSGQADHLGDDDSLEELVRTMARHEVKRLPVIDGHTLIGMVSEAVLAAHATPDQVVSAVWGVDAD
jgi:predicted transcriptional regulator